MPSQSLEDLFLLELSEIYGAEKQILGGLADMVKAASSPALKAAFQTHKSQTKTQVQRLEKTFKILDEKPSDTAAPGVKSLIRSGKKLASQQDFDPSLIDAGLIASAQKIEHYEIAAYGCLRTHAKLLGYTEIESLLADSLAEEEQTDRLLTEIAQETVNVSAAEAPYAGARTGNRRSRSASSGANSPSVLGNLAVGLAIGGAVWAFGAMLSPSGSRHPAWGPRP